VGARSLRTRRLAPALALAAGLALGCSWEDLTESGIRKTQPRPAAPAQPAGPGGPQAAAPAGTRPNGWADARSLSPEDADASIVSCRVGRSVKFMREADCLARGGSTAR